MPEAHDASSSILVTGGGGYIGGHTVLELLDRGERVVVVDDFSTTPRRTLPSAAALVIADIGNRKAVDDILKRYRVREIIHFAAKIVVPESVSDPLGYYHSNTVKTHGLIAAAVANGVERFVFSSTAAVYGNPRILPVGEGSPTNPLSPYGASKLMAERILADAGHAHGIRYAILRYFNVAGADPAGRFGHPLPHATHLISSAVQAALGRRSSLTIFGTDYETPDGTGVRDYIHVSDLAAVHLAALQDLRTGNGNVILNCGYGRGYSVMEVVESVKRVSGVNFPVVIGPRRDGDPASVVADVSRLRERINWNPRHDDLGTIVSTTLEWEKKRGKSTELLLRGSA